MAVGGPGAGRATGGLITGKRDAPVSPGPTLTEPQTAATRAALDTLCAFYSRSFESTSLAARSAVLRVGRPGAAQPDSSGAAGSRADSQRSRGRSVVTLKAPRAARPAWWWPPGVPYGVLHRKTLVQKSCCL
ncbi:hypothetical protein Hamer_G016712 [Homarus americanus]|uniref:Uncharacterized protein n=1 Tax=Homarus americanus TaxID=6706 RepID=A0A8J5TM34_HOMAM|nr:hypothetical protein Hamer_G016712 [Homarus americanus]